MGRIRVVAFVIWDTGDVNEILLENGGFFWD